jgi:hypothetical protein
MDYLWEQVGVDSLWSRVFCLVNKHKWGAHVYSNADYVPKPDVLKEYVQCSRCGASSVIKSTFTPEAMKVHGFF